jgi:endo-1,4-beta-D-glucanase Y
MKRVRGLAVVLVISALAGLAVAVEFPYTKGIVYPQGFMPTTLKRADFDGWYEKYKKSGFLADCNGGIRTTCKGENSDGGDGTTKVESIGWSMIIAAYMADKATFDGLYKFYNSKKQSHGMMAWKVSCTGVQDAGSASDGDLDVAFAMVVAAWQWGGTYKDEAKKVISTVKKLITQCSGTSVIVGGYSGSGAYGGCNETDISYYTPAFFREIAKFSGDNAWDKLADDTYKVLEANTNSSTGLVPDWHKYNGGASTGNHSGAYSYKFDACRVPWRIAIDYLWNGNEKAKTWCTKISSWANKVGPGNIKDGYSLDGSSIGSYHNLSFVGGFAVAAMCNSQEIADAFGKEMVKMGYDNGYWYHGILGVAYAMTMTGNLWKPELVEKQSGTTSVGQGRDGLSSANSLTITNRMNRELLIRGMSNITSMSLAAVDGRQVKQRNQITETNPSIDISSIKQGCYILTIQTGNQSEQKRQLVVIH